MTRAATIALLVLVLAAGGAVYGLAERTAALRAELVTLNASSARERETIHVLRAEWSFLNKPERLAALAEQFLAMQPLAVNQIISFAEIPRPVGVRPASTPPPMPAERAHGAPDVLAAARPLPKPYEAWRNPALTVARADPAPTGFAPADPRPLDYGGSLLIAADFEP